MQSVSSTFSKKIFEGKGAIKVEDFDNIYGENHCRITSGYKDYATELDELIKVSEPLCHKYSGMIQTGRPIKTTNF